MPYKLTMVLVKPKTYWIHVSTYTTTYYIRLKAFF